MKYFRNILSFWLFHHTVGFYVDWSESRNYRKDLGYWINMVNAEVVGNIFDNPELIKESDT